MSLRRVEKTSNTSNNEVVCYNFILDMYTYYGNADVTLQDTIWTNKTSRIII